MGDIIKHSSIYLQVKLLEISKFLARADSHARNFLLINNHVIYVAPIRYNTQVSLKDLLNAIYVFVICMYCRVIGKQIGITLFSIKREVINKQNK